MALAFDSGIYAQTSASSPLTFAFNNAAGNVVYVMGTDTNTPGASLVTGVTYGGVAMTKIGELDANASLNDRAITVWRLVGPATGSNNVVVTASAGNNFRFHALSYSGADQTTPENGTDTSTGTSVSTISTDITTTIDNCWMVQFSKDQNGGRTYTSTTGDTIRLNADAGGHYVVDTGAAITPAGSNTMTSTMTSVNGIGAVAWAIRPSGGAVNTTNFFYMT